MDFIERADTDDPRILGEYDYSARYSIQYRKFLFEIDQLTT